jgi:putative YphP/YqiW family bacilliredoxin
MPPMYDPEAVRPMWEELVAVGIQPLTTPEEVDAVLGEKTGSTLVVLNSVCGCAAGNCRPGVMLALQNERIPDRLVTVFAGMDTEAVQQARGYFDFQPSSPNVVLFKDGAPVMALQRFHIERMSRWISAMCWWKASTSTAPVKALPSRRMSSPSWTLSNSVAPPSRSTRATEAGEPSPTQHQSGCG